MGSEHVILSLGGNTPEQQQVCLGELLGMNKLNNTTRPTQNTFSCSFELLHDTPQSTYIQFLNLVNFERRASICTPYNTTCTIHCLLNRPPKYIKKLIQYIDTSLKFKIVLREIEARSREALSSSSEALLRSIESTCPSLIVVF